MSVITVATLPLCLRNRGPFRIPEGFVAVDIETYRIINEESADWLDFIPVTLIGIGYGWSYIRIRVEGGEPWVYEFLKWLLKGVINRVAAWNIKFEGCWFRIYEEGLRLFELQPAPTQKGQDGVKKEPSLYSYARKMGWTRHSPVVGWKRLLEQLEKEASELRNERFMKLIDEVKNMKVGEAIGRIGEEWDVLNLDDDARIICDTVVTWKNYRDIIHEGLRLKKLIDSSLKKSYESITGVRYEASDLLEILGSRPNALTLCLAPEKGGEVCLWLKPAIPILRELQRIIPDINAETEIVYYELLKYFHKLGDVETLYYF